ncbi:MAG: CoA transferase [Chloroflexi bacterium]|nr:MAG: CoA transferase [Chloroflexota bacterium]
MVTGIYSAMGIITALYAREKSGRGQFLDMTLLESQTAWLAVQASGWMNAGLKPQRIGNTHACIVPYDVFKTEDKYIIVAVGTEKLWSNFCDSLGIEYLKDDPRFACNADRVQHREALMAILQEIFRTRPAEFWLTRLHEAGVPSGPINTVEDALNHPQHRARNFIVQLEHPALGPVWSLGNPLRLGDTPPTYRLPPPMLGQHTEEVLGSLGYGPAELEALRAQGVV